MELPNLDPTPVESPPADLWGVPRDAVELDDFAFLGNSDILDRLSAVFPESESVVPGLESAAGAPSGRVSTATRPRVVEPDDGRGRRRLRQTRAPRGRSGAISVGVVLLSFSGAVLAGIALEPAPSSATRSVPSNPMDLSTQIVTNDSSACPMSVLPSPDQKAAVEPSSGNCFYVG